MAGFFLYANVFIALCATLCIAGTRHIYGLAPFSAPVIVYAAAAVIIIYNLHYYYSGGHSKSQRRVWFQHNQKRVYLLMLLSLVAILVYAPRLNNTQILTAALTGLLGILYSMPLLPGRKRLNQYGIIKILVLSLSWTAFTTWWPVAGNPVHRPFLWLLLAERWLFFLTLCLLLDIRDRDADAARGVQTIPVRLGTAASYRLAAGLTAIMALLNMIHAVQRHPPALFNAFLLTTLLTGFMGWLCYRQPRPLTWLVGVDGLLLVHGLLLLAVQ